ncbi:hypothetical protein ACN4EG_19885 [Alkalinema pantanalense CENA528]|uniref:hypothetical protein n=1 Tax=Alkalinema pantanalense TaxID=1620705 RepID=UPI003D6EF2E1
MAKVEATKIEHASEKLKTLNPGQLEAMLGLMDGWQLEASPTQEPPVTAAIAESVVNGWLLEVLPDRFMAAEPRMIAAGDIWYVPVVLTYPIIGEVGQVGEVLVSAFSAGMISATSPDVMRSHGLKLYEERSHEIESAFL